jgi:DNA polymerase V
MVLAGIHSGDMLVVDRALTPKNDDVVVAVIDGEFTVKRYQRHADGLYFIPENPDYSPIILTPDSELECHIWGVVTYVIHKP